MINSKLNVRLEAKLFGKYAIIGYYNTVEDALADSSDWKEVEIRITIVK